VAGVNHRKLGQTLGLRLPLVPLYNSSMYASGDAANIGLIGDASSALAFRRSAQVGQSPLKARHLSLNQHKPQLGLYLGQTRFS
jgi:hypothetical protein